MPVRIDPWRLEQLQTDDTPDLSETADLVEDLVDARAQLVSLRALAEKAMGWLQGEDESVPLQIAAEIRAALGGDQ